MLSKTTVSLILSALLTVFSAHAQYPVNVAGEIRLRRPIRVKAPYISIYGQTAPGDGIVVTGHTVEVDTHDVIIRYMRFRREYRVLC